MQKWLSFIVPVYNVEDYLSECIKSLLNQNTPLDEYEILLLDDGSTDNSLQIAESYAKQYKNILVFTHPNAGVSYTRNEGICRANGKYIWFVDSDDCIAENVLPILYMETQKANLDMLIFNYMRFKDTNYWRHEAFDVKESAIKSGVDLFLGFYYEPTVWNRLLSRNFLQINQLQFVLGNLSEDIEFSIRCMYHAERVKSIAVDALYYRVVDNSLSHNEANKRNIVIAFLNCLESHYEYMKQYPIPYSFWMRVFVHDVRRIHIRVDSLDGVAKERRAFLKRERKILKEIMGVLPISLRLDYWILFLVVFSPAFVLQVQHLLRNLKRWIKR